MLNRLQSLPPGSTFEMTAYNSEGNTFSTQTGVPFSQTAYTSFLLASSINMHREYYVSEIPKFKNTIMSLFEIALPVNFLLSFGLIFTPFPFIVYFIEKYGLETDSTINEVSPLCCVNGWETTITILMLLVLLSGYLNHCWEILRNLCIFTRLFILINLIFFACGIVSDRTACHGVAVKLLMIFRFHILAIHVVLIYQSIKLERNLKILKQFWLQHYVCYLKFLISLLLLAFSVFKNFQKMNMKNYIWHKIHVNIKYHKTLEL